MATFGRSLASRAPHGNTVTGVRLDTDWLIAVSLGVAMIMPTLFNYVSSSPLLIPLSLFFFMPPLILLLPSKRIDENFFFKYIFFLLIMVGSLILSMIIHFFDYSTQQAARAIVRVFALFVYVTIAAMLAVHPRGDKIFGRAMQILAIELALFYIAMAVVDTHYVNRRLTPGDMHPNWWGNTLVALSFAAAFFSRRWLRYALWAVALAGTFLAQSRGALVTIVLVMGFATLAHEGLRRLVVAGLVGFFGLLVPLAVLEFGFDAVTVLRSTYDFVANDVLLLDNPYRGVASGGAGRVEHVQLGMALFAERPFLGVGFGLQRETTADELNFDYAMHNGMLLLLVELGAILFALFFTVIVVSVVRAGSAGNWRLFALPFSYWFFLAQFAPRSVNVAILPMLATMMVMAACIRPDFVRVDSGRWAAAAAAGEERRRPSRRLGARWRQDDG
jgi:hypothetical protein